MLNITRSASTENEPVTVTGTVRVLPESAKEGLARWQEESKKAKSVVREWLDGSHDTVTEELVTALNTLFPKKTKHASAAKTSAMDKFANFLADGPKSLMEIFKEFKMGEGEVRIRIKDLIQKRSGNDRVWIKHNEADDTYEIVARGDDVPNGWRGPFPKSSK